MKVKCDHRSKFSNFKQLERRSLKKKNQGFNGIRTRDLRDTGAMLYQLSYEATYWERGQFIEFISSRAVKWCEVYMKYCNDPSSLSSTSAVQIWILSYKLHITSVLLYVICCAIQWFKLILKWVGKILHSLRFCSSMFSLLASHKNQLKTVSHFH